MPKHNTLKKRLDRMITDAEIVCGKRVCWWYCGLSWTSWWWVRLALSERCIRTDADPTSIIDKIKAYEACNSIVRWWHRHILCREALYALLIHGLMNTKTHKQWFHAVMKANLSCGDWLIRQVRERKKISTAVVLVKKHKSTVSETRIAKSKPLNSSLVISPIQRNETNTTLRSHAAVEGEFARECHEVEKTAEVLSYKVEALKRERNHMTTHMQDLHQAQKNTLLQVNQQNRRLQQHRTNQKNLQDLLQMLQAQQDKLENTITHGLAHCSVALANHAGKM